MNSKHNRSETDPTTERVGWVQRYRASGMGLKRFAAEHGLRASQLHYWIYGARASSAVPTPAAPVFREVAVPREWKSQPAWAAEIGLPDGTTVRLDGRADIAWAGSLVESLRRPCSR